MIRVDREVFDPIGVGSTAGGSRVFEDGIRTPVWADRPGQSREAYIVSEALRIMAVPADTIRQTRPPVPQQLFPETTGYDHTPLTISDILDTNRWSPKIRSWTSGTQSQPRKSDIQQEMWESTSRNIGMTANPML